MSITNKIILGIDPGYADTGFGVISMQAGRAQFIQAGIIKTTKQSDFSLRLATIYDQISQLLVKFNPDLVAVEKIFFSKNAKTALDVGQARGVVLLAIRQNDKKLLELTPSQIKQAICSSGNASKEQVGRMVKSILKLKTVLESDDAADALAAALAAAFTNTQLQR